jgi:hypothetical protein
MKLKTDERSYFNGRKVVVVTLLSKRFKLGQEK